MSGLETSGMWFVSSAICGAALLLMGSLATWLAREPVYRIRIIQCTLLAALVAPVVQSSKILPEVNVWLGTRAAESGFAAETLTTPMSRLNSPSISDGRSAEHAGNELPMSPAETSARRASAPASGNSSVEIAQQITRPATGFLNAIDLLRAFQFAYLISVGAILILWGEAWRRRSRLARDASPANEELCQLLASVGDGRVAQTQLLVSKSISSPVMWGLVRPTIVIPAAFVAQADPTALRWSLAHEWAHVVRHDIATLNLANLGKLVFFYHPLYWWLRRQLTLSQDFLADAFAARQTEAKEEYASFIVALAKSKRQIALTGTLGIGGRRSNLFRRVERLLNSNRPPAEQIRRGPAVGIVAVTLFATVAVSGVRLSAEPPTLEPVADQAASIEERSKNSSGNDQANAPEPITYESQVVDRVTGKPIAGATIRIKHKLSKDPETGGWKTLQTTTHTSDEQGRFQFTLPPEEVAQRSLYLEVDANHPEYQPLGGVGYSHAMIRKNLANGDAPFFSNLKLSPGQPITATVLEPNGTPSAGTKFIIYSKAPTKKRSDWKPGAFQDGTTDENGVLKAVVATPGDGVLWVCPKDFSPVAIRLGDERGNLDPIRLEQGTRLSGRVLDREGNPVPGVAVNASHLPRDASAASEYLRMNSVGSQIGAGGRTDTEGRFLLNPVPAGEYRLEVSNFLNDPSSPPEETTDKKLDHLFVPLGVTLEEGEEVEPIEIQAHPEVIVRGRFFDSKGNPRPSHEQDLFGKINGTSFFKRSTKPAKDGWFEFRAPRGLEDTQLLLVTNEHSALRWRLKPGDSLQSTPRPQLGALDKDLTTIEIVHYDAPLLTVKVVNDDGELIRDANIITEYSNRSTAEPLHNQWAANGVDTVSVDITFERQSDGRYRSSQMLPEEEVKVTVQKDGYTTTPQTVKLKEGESLELLFVLTKSKES